MGVFVSYSSRDKDAVTRLTQDLQDADEQVWLDQRLAGGDAWWRAILEQIRCCDVFIFALSQNSIQSKPCQAELHYAQDLGLPILPVQVGHVDSMQLNPLATVQTVDYRTSTSTVGMRLLTALNRARAQRQPLPSPLPDEPPVPFEYLIRLYTTISGTDQLSPSDQAALVAQLQFGLREDGDHDAARNDIVMLLTKLRDREDVTYRTRTDVDAILAGIHPAPHPESDDIPASSTMAEKTEAQIQAVADDPEAPKPGVVTPADDRRIASQQHAAPAVPLLQRLTRPKILASVAVVAVAATAVVAVVLTTGNRSSPHAGIASSTTSTTAALTPAQSRLLGLVSSYKCTPQESRVGIAQVSCDSGSSALNQLYFTLFADQPSLDRAMAAPPQDYGETSRSFTLCPPREALQPGPQDWHRATDPQHSAGKIECLTSPNEVRWSVDSELLLGEAANWSGELSSIYQWWEAGNQ